MSTFGAIGLFYHRRRLGRAARPATSRPSEPKKALDPTTGDIVAGSPVREPGGKIGIVEAGSKTIVFENRRTCKGTRGSNPFPSADFYRNPQVVGVTRRM